MAQLLSAGRLEVNKERRRRIGAVAAALAGIALPLLIGGLIAAQVTTSRGQGLAEARPDPAMPYPGQNGGAAQLTGSAGEPIKATVVLTEDELREPSELLAIIDWPVELRTVTVREVADREVFWIGQEDSEWLLIVLASELDASDPADVANGDVVTIKGYIRDATQAGMIDSPSIAVREALAQAPLFVEAASLGHSG